jgi:hypothetical protein
MRIIKTLIVIILLAVGVRAQIQQNFDISDPEYVWPGGGVAERQIMGSFTFESLPEPLKATRVHYTLRIAKNGPSAIKEDWTLKVNYQDDAVRLRSDSVIFWPGPHHIDDQLSGVIEFMPLRSGRWSINIYLDDTNIVWIGYRLAGGLVISWCFDGDGKLQYLGKGSVEQTSCTDISNFFFNRDSVVVSESEFSIHSYAFKYRIVIHPTPKIGDTCQIHYYLTANEDLYDCCDITVALTCARFVERPREIGGFIKKGQLVEDSMKIVLLPVRNDHAARFSMEFTPADKDRYKNQLIPLHFIFREDGGLRYINAEGFPYWKYSDIYPTSFPVYEYSPNNDLTEEFKVPARDK